MNRKQRILWKRAGTLRDLSDTLGDFRRGDVVFDYSVGDYLYIGTELPFNHRYFDVKAPNDVASALTVQIWDGTAWKATVDLGDGTIDAAAPATALSKSGIVVFSPDIDVSGWASARDSKIVDGLEATRIFSLYWARLAWSATFNVETELSYVGLRFSDDTDLASYYPDTTNASLKDAFATGKTDWKDQSFAAADEIVQDLRRQNIVIRGEQILDPSLFLMASIHKTASLIYRGISNFRDRVTDAEAAYSKAMALKFFEVDRNADAVKDFKEVKQSTEFARR